MVEGGGSGPPPECWDYTAAFFMKILGRIRQKKDISHPRGSFPRMLMGDPSLPPNLGGGYHPPRRARQRPPPLAKHHSHTRMHECGESRGPLGDLRTLVAK